MAVLCGAKGRGKAVLSLQRQRLGTQLLEKKKSDVTSKRPVMRSQNTTISVLSATIYEGKKNASIAHSMHAC